MSGDQKNPTEKKNSDFPGICRGLDSFISIVGKSAAWLNVILVALIFVQVVMRYVFDINYIAMEEVQWHLYGVAAMFGLSYCVVIDNHIRLDILHEHFSPKTKEIVEFLGILLLLLPAVTVLFIHGIDFVESSYRVGESSRSPMGLPWRWAIKTVIPVSMALFGLAGISRAIRCLVLIFKVDKGASLGSQ